MGVPSITSTDSFERRLQNSEGYRVKVWCLALIGMLALTSFRRLTGGVVMTSNWVFYPTVAIYLAALGYQALVLLTLRKLVWRTTLLPAWRWNVNAIVDLLTPIALLTITAWFSPRGSVTALSGPVLLLFPLLILLSVLRLRPKLSLLTGIGAGVSHWLLMARAAAVTWIGAENYAVSFTYGAILILTGAAGMVVAYRVKSYVREAANDAVRHEQASMRVSNMQRDLAVAREIQRGLLPEEAPDFEGFDIAGMNRPADLTGGDYYDWQEMPDGRLVCVLADVAGHGIGPAIVMAVCRAYARASAAVMTDPASIMTRLNQFLHDDLPADRFITLVIAVLSRDGRVELLSAGHGPTLLLNSATSEVSQYEGDGLPLGVYPEERYGPAVSFRMDPGDVLILMTDGFFEWQNATDEPFGMKRIRDVLVERKENRASEILQGLDETVRRFAAGAPQTDDVTAVVIKRTGGSSVTSSGMTQRSVVDALPVSSALVSS